MWEGTLAIAKGYGIATHFYIGLGRAIA
jgi:hypothetical protein